MSSPAFVAFVQDGKPRLDFPSQFFAYVKRFEGEEIEITVSKRKAQRTDRQNRALHAMLTPWAHEAGYSLDELKRALMGEVFGWQTQRNPITGQDAQVPVRPHTSALNVADFCHLIDEALRIAAECGVILVAPDEYRKAKEAAAKQAVRTGRAA